MKFGADNLPDDPVLLKALILQLQEENAFARLKHYRAVASRLDKLKRNYESNGRGRDGSYLPPPAQIRTCGTTAYGSCLRFVTRSVPPDRDVQFWASVCRCLRDDQSVTTGAGYAGCAA